MILGISIRKNAKNIDVCVKTYFYMRHKILDCIREFMGIVDGIEIIWRGTSGLKVLMMVKKSLEQRI